MQLNLAFDDQRLGRMRSRLRSVFGVLRDDPKRDPVSQLVRSLIGSRTRDEVSFAAFERLQRRFPSWGELAMADAKEIKAIIADVTFPEKKVPYLVAALRGIENRIGSLDLDFLADMPVEDALAWLEQLPGVGRKVAAAVLNFSTLNKRAMVVDSHVARVSKRLGLARSGGIRIAYKAIMAAVPDRWDAEDLRELHCLMKGLGQGCCRHALLACRRCPLSEICRTGRDKSRFGGFESYRSMSPY
jgi:endonuclease III